LNRCEKNPGVIPFSNLSEYLSLGADRFPSKPAFLHPVYITYGALEQEVNRYAHGLQKIGICRGSRSILLVSPGIEFFALAFALVRVGSVPVMIDPGIGAKTTARSLAHIEADSFIGSSKAHFLRMLFPGAFKTVRICLTLGRRWFWRGYGLKDVQSVQKGPFPPAPMNPEEPAAIFFTSGSTGPPKGVVYTASMMNAQIRLLQSQFMYRPEEIDLCTFPLVSFFSLCLGLTLVLADMDMSRPATLNPQKIIDNIQKYGCTQMFCSPMVLHRLAGYGGERNIRLSSLRRVITAGAPVTSRLLQSFKRMLDSDAEIYAPYGATEALPVTKVNAAGLLKSDDTEIEGGRGICLGHPLNGMDIRIIAISDHPIEQWDQASELPAEEVGEIVVKGPVVSDKYYQMPDADACSKIKDTRGGGVWHRMGDLGRIDHTGRLWFYGRKSHRIITADRTLFTIPCEAVFNRHPRVFRSALVGVPDSVSGYMKPVLCVQLEPGDRGRDRRRLIRELLETGAADPMTQSIRMILFPGRFPVDARHNAKIYREKLALWAARRVR